MYWFIIIHLLGALTSSSLVPETRLGPWTCGSLANDEGPRHCPIEDSADSFWLWHDHLRTPSLDNVLDSRGWLDFGSLELNSKEKTEEEESGSELSKMAFRLECVYTHADERPVYTGMFPGFYSSFCCDGIWISCGYWERGFLVATRRWPRSPSAGKRPPHSHDSLHQYIVQRRISSLDHSDLSPALFRVFSLAEFNFLVFKPILSEYRETILTSGRELWARNVSWIQNNGCVMGGLSLRCLRILSWWYLSSIGQDSSFCQLPSNWR